MLYRVGSLLAAPSRHTGGHTWRISLMKNVRIPQSRPSTQVRQLVVSCRDDNMASAHRYIRSEFPCCVSDKPPDGCLDGVRRKECRPFRRPPGSSLVRRLKFSTFWTLSTLGSCIVVFLFSSVPLVVGSSLDGNRLSSSLSSSAENSWSLTKITISGRSVDEFLDCLSPPASLFAGPEDISVETT